MVIASFLFKPYLEADEKISKVFHRHPFVMFVDLMRLFFFGFIVPFFLYYLFPSLVLFFAIWMVISCVRILYIIFNWYHDALLITNVSLLHVEWNGFFDRTSARLEYQMIEGTAAEIRGFLRTIFNYGNVSVQGGGTPLQLKDAMNPKRVEKQIMMFQEKFVNNQTIRNSNTLKSLLTTMIQQHAKTHGVPEGSLDQE